MNNILHKGMDTALFSELRRLRKESESGSNPSVAAPRSDEVSGVCKDCNIQMEINEDMYSCPKCGQLITREITIAQESYVPPSAHRSSTTRDQQQITFNDLLEKLNLHERAHKHAPSRTILAQTAASYATLRENSQKSGLAFRHGDIMNEILSAILYNECLRAREIYTKKEIAEFMGLKTDGFSRGNDQLLSLQSSGYYTPLTDEQRCECMIASYFSMILKDWFDEISGGQLSRRIANIETMQDDAALPPIERTFWEILYDVLIEFTHRIIMTTITNNICAQNQMSSRVVGTIWYIVNRMQIPITARDIEQRSRGTKKDTFIKFSMVIRKNRFLQAVVRQYFIGADQ